MSPLDVIAWLLIGLAVVDVGVTSVLVRAARRVREPALQERATISVVLTFGALCAAIMATARIFGIALMPWVTFSLFIAILVLVSLPQLVWYAMYRLGRFR